MKKKFFPALSVALVMISVYLVSCSKSSDTTNQFGTSVNPVDALTGLSIYDTPYSGGSQSFTMGLLFRSAKAGRITHLCARLSPGTYTVALWDSSAQSVIKSTLITVADSSQNVFADIDDVSITAGKTYAISVNNTPAASTHRNYWIYIISSPANNFPRTLGDITFLREIEKQTADPLSLFPASYEAPDYLIGVPVFKFEPHL